MNFFAMVEPLQNGLMWTGDGRLIVNSSAPLVTGIRFVQSPRTIENLM